MNKTEISSRRKGCRVTKIIHKMKFNNSNLDYWKMSSMSITDSLNIVDMGCSARDCRDCDCDCENEDDEDNDQEDDDDGWDDDTIIDYMFPDEDAREELYD